MQTLFIVVGVIYLFGVSAWTCGALYYDAGRRTKIGWALVVAWLLLVVAMVVIVKPFGLSLLAITGVFALILTWWFTQKPSHDRSWDPNFAQLSQIKIDEDKITVTNVRNTDYRSLEDYDVCYETRTYQLSKLKALDLLVLYWGSQWMSHPMAIFEFDGEHLCFSIEVRYRMGESYDIIRSLFRQNELMYVVCDERDAILRRTKYSVGHDCYLYRLQTDLDQVRMVLMEYIDATNAICDAPRWYNAITSNCTTAIYLQRQRPIAWDWRIVFNGNFDKLIYDRDLMVKDVPFDELKQNSHIIDMAILF